MLFLFKAKYRRNINTSEIDSEVRNKKNVHKNKV